MRLKLTFILSLLFITTSVYSAGEITLPGLTNPDAVLVDDQQIYVVEFPTVHIYSLKDFKRVKSFGRRGEGPGELLKYAQLYVLPDRLMIGDRNKVIFFGKDGTFQKELKPKALLNWGAAPLGKNFIGKSKGRDGKVEYNTAVIYSPTLEKVKEITRSRFFYTEWKGGKKCDAVAVRGLQFQVWDGRVFVQKDPGFVIEVYDSAGSLVRTIRRDVKPVPMTAKAKENYRDYFRSTMPWKRMYEGQFKNELSFPEHLPAICRFLVTDGKIYAMTYKQKDGKSQFIILDTKGKLIRETFLPFERGDDWFQHSLTKSTRRHIGNPTFTIRNNKLYQLVENQEEEEWELRVTDI